VSLAILPTAPIEYELGGEHKNGSWTDYLQGVTHVLAAATRAGDLAAPAGGAGIITGFDARISSSIPLGAGLSSSASFEVAMLRALRAAFALPLDDLMVARLGQRVETDFVGAPVGIMDQMAASLADGGAALFVDTRSLGYEKVPLPAHADLVVIDSGVTHGHAAGEYRTRRAECERAATALGVRFLRDLSVSDLDRIAALPPPLDRRARHVVTENARVLAAVAALRAGDLPTLGALLAAGHVSLRDDFEVSIPEIDLLVSIAARTDGVHGARLTGGGFGGSVVVLADRDRAATAAATIADEYAAATGRHLATFRVRD